MAKPSKLDAAIADARADWEEAEARVKLTSAVLQALNDAKGGTPTTEPKKRGRKPKGLPKTNGAEVTA